MARGKELIGRGAHGRNAVASITPVAERQEDGSWIPISSTRILFPPDGSVEVRGVLATSIRDGEWFLFSTAPNDRHRAPVKYRALHPRRLTRFLDFPAGETSEARRRLVVEIGLEAGAPGEWAVRINPDEIVRVTLASGDDGRWRAERSKFLAQLPVRRFDPDCVVPLPGTLDAPLLYDFDASVQTGHAVNWSTDADYLRMVCSALAAGGRHDATRALEVLAAQAEATRGASAVNGADPAILNDTVRTGAIVERLKADEEALSMAANALASQPEVQEVLRNLADAKASEEIPKLEIAARARIEREWQAEHGERLARASTEIAELKAEELASLERMRAAALADIEAAAVAERAKASAEAEAEAEEIRRRLREELEVIQGRIRLSEEALAAFEGRRACLTETVAALSESEAALIGRVEALSQDADRLSRWSRSALGHATFPVLEKEGTVSLGEIEASALKLKVLTAEGVEAVARLAVLLAAGEVPIIRGHDGRNLIEIATILLAGGRMARLHADPTLVTYDDLWSRPGGGPLTAFGSAAAWTAETNRPVLGYISGAEHSAARFWYPALADAKRRGLLPRTLMLCVGLEDAAVEEAAALPKDAFAVASETLLNPKAIPVIPRVLSATSAEPRSLDLSQPVVDEAAAALMLAKHGGGLSIEATLRLVRLYAAACAAFGDERGFAFAANAAQALAASVNASQPFDPSVQMSLAANA